MKALRIDETLHSRELNKKVWFQMRQAYIGRGPECWSVSITVKKHLFLNIFFHFQFKKKYFFSFQIFNFKLKILKINILKNKNFNSCF